MHHHYSPKDLAFDKKLTEWRRPTLWQKCGFRAEFLTKSATSDEKEIVFFGGKILWSLIMVSDNTIKITSSDFSVTFITFYSSVLYCLNCIYILQSILAFKKQEAPLTLRGQRGRCRNIKGDLQIFGSFPSPRLRLPFLWVWFFGGSWQTQVVHQIWSR